MRKCESGIEKVEFRKEKTQGSAVHEFHELTRIIPDIQTIIGV